MKSIFKNLNLLFRSFILDDVEKKFDGPLHYHKEFGSKKSPVERISKRFDEQKTHNKQF